MTPIDPSHDLTMTSRQRIIAEITEMIHTAKLIHCGVVEMSRSPDHKVTAEDKDPSNDRNMASLFTRVSYTYTMVPILIIIYKPMHIPKPIPKYTPLLNLYTYTSTYNYAYTYIYNYLYMILFIPILKPIIILIPIYITIPSQSPFSIPTYTYTYTYT